MTTALPEVKSTMEERIKALQVAKPLLTSTTFMSATGAGVIELIRVAEYITTGHDYFDTHAAEEITLEGDGGCSCGEADSDAHGEEKEDPSV